MDPFCFQPDGLLCVVDMAPSAGGQDAYSGTVTAVNGNRQWRVLRNPGQDKVEVIQLFPQERAEHTTQEQLKNAYTGDLERDRVEASQVGDHARAVDTTVAKAEAWPPGIMMHSGATGDGEAGPPDLCKVQCRSGRKVCRRWCRVQCCCSCRQNSRKD